MLFHSHLLLGEANKHVKDFCVSIYINIVYIAKIKRSSKYSGYYNSEAGLRIKQHFREYSYLLVL